MLKHIWSSKAIESRLFNLIIRLSADGNLLHASFVYIFTRHHFHPDKLDQLMNHLPPRAKKTFKSTYDQLLEKGIGIGVEKGIGIGVEKGIGIGEENSAKNQLRFWLQVKKYSIPFIAEISGRSEEEILEDIKKWNLEFPAHE